MLTKSINDLIEHSKNVFAEAFLQKKADEFEQFSQQEAAKQAVAEQFRTLAEKLAAQRTAHDFLAETVKSYQGADFATSIYRGLAASPGGALNIQTVAANFTSSHLIHQYGPEIIQISAQELADREQEFEAFQREHDAVLRGLGLIE